MGLFYATLLVLATVFVIFLLPAALCLLAAAFVPDALIRSRVCRGVTFAGGVLVAVLIL